MTLYLKALDENGRAFHGGSGQWHKPAGKRPGKWMPPIADPMPCKRGYHLCRDTADLLHWLAPTVWLAEAKGKIVPDGNKVAVERARLVRRLPWDDRTARLFAADCAERVLPIFEKARPNDTRPREAIEVARRFAEGGATRGELVAGWAAAGDAAGDAGWAAAGWDAAAGAAAWAAAWAAAGWDAAAGAAAWAAAGAAAGDAAAWAAAGDAAARDAARAAARAAAGDAAWEWQAERLTHYLGIDL